MDSNRRTEENTEAYLLLVLEMAMSLTDKQIELFNEAVEENIERKRLLIQWAKEFQAMPKADDDWAEEYYEMVDAFVEKKIVDLAIENIPEMTENWVIINKQKDNLPVAESEVLILTDCILEGYFTGTQFFAGDYEVEPSQWKYVKTTK